MPPPQQTMEQPPPPSSQPTAPSPPFESVLGEGRAPLVPSRPCSAHRRPREELERSFGEAERTMAALLVRCVIVAHRAPRRRRSSSRSPSCSGARSPSRLRRRCRRRRRRRRRRLEGVVLDTGGAPCTGGALYKVPAVPMPAAAVGAAVAPTDLALEGGALARAVPALGLERARRPRVPSR